MNDSDFRAKYDFKVFKKIVFKYFGGWERDFEFLVWHSILVFRHKEDGAFTISDDDLRKLHKLSKKIGGWYHYEDNQIRFVPKSIWDDEYAEWKASLKRRI